jgi:hypothetical protein
MRSTQCGISLVPLVPFDGKDPGDRIIVHAGARRVDGQLLLEYRLEDPDHRVRLASPADHPGRREGLWRTTCFEAFFGLPGDPGYWELNLGPCGHWNLARFVGYRQSAVEGLGPGKPDVLRQDTTTGLRLACRLALDLPGLDGSCPELGLCAVLEYDTRGTVYHALAHPGPGPDFHDRQGWLWRWPPAEDQDDAEL